MFPDTMMELGNEAMDLAKGAIADIIAQVPDDVVNALNSAISAAAFAGSLVFKEIFEVMKEVIEAAVSAGKLNQINHRVDVLDTTTSHTVIYSPGLQE